jgi:hypothetical protein
MQVLKNAWQIYVKKSWFAKYPINVDSFKVEYKTGRYHELSVMWLECMNLKGGEGNSLFIEIELTFRVTTNWRIRRPSSAIVTLTGKMEIFLLRDSF